MVRVRWLMPTKIIGPSPRSPRGGEGLPSSGITASPLYKSADPINYKLLKDFARENR